MNSITTLFSESFSSIKRFSKFKFLLFFSGFLLTGFQNIIGQRQFFDLDQDLLLAHYDLKPDDDDVMAAAALASMLQHPDLAGVNFHAVAGAYGMQNSNYIEEATPDFFNTIFGPENVFWSDADREREAATNRVKDLVIDFLNSGNQVFVQEGGQSDFTYDVLIAVVEENNGINAAMVEANVTVVQHSDRFNENEATPFKLDWIRANTQYTNIDNGNIEGNGTPRYAASETTWLDQATSSSNPNNLARTYWSAAKDVLTSLPSNFNRTIRDGGVDFSDCVENWWIFEIGDDADDVQSFWDRYVINTPENNVIDSECDEIIFNEVDGVVIIEAENTESDLDEWDIETTELNNDFTGSSYIEFTGNNVRSGNPNSPLEYQFKINEPGLYELHLRCARETVTLNGEVRTDVANDCYVRVDGDYGAGPNIGDSHGDQARLEDLMSDVKFFGGNDHSFVWADGNRLDLGGERNKRDAIYDFKAGEVYTLTVSGRSQLFKLDRMMFRKTSVNESEAESLSNIETIIQGCGENEVLENNAPSVEIDTPVNESLFNEGIDIALEANAFDSDGTISQVEFFVNNELLRTERVVPYTATMSGFEPGNYSITAVATDNRGLQTTSQPIVINIEETLSIGQNGFNKESDLFVAQFDNYPDSDDIHSQAATASFLSHPDFQDVNYITVHGAYGNQPTNNSSWEFIDSRSLFEIAFGDEGVNWIDARADRIENGDYTYSADFVADRALPILEAGGTVWVMEGGQSNITADWIAALIDQGVTNTQTNVVVVHHSRFNEGQTDDDDLDYVRDNTNYVQIDDGNSPWGSGTNRGDNTPDYQESSDEFIPQIISSNNVNDFTRSIWTLADDLALNSPYEAGPIPGGGIDFSDVVQAMWIFGLNDEFRTVQSYLDEFVIDTNNNIESSAPEVEITTPTNGLNFEVGEIISLNAEALDIDGTISQVQFFVNGDLLKTERNAPYRATISDFDSGNYTITAVATDNDGLTTTSESIFISIGDASSSVNLIGKTIRLRSYFGTYVSNNITENNIVEASSFDVTDTEVAFVIEDAGDGFIALRSSVNARYLAADIRVSEDAPLIANRTRIGPWEKFELINNEDGSISFRSNITNLFVSADRLMGQNIPLVANRSIIERWEKFNVEELTSNKGLLDNIESIDVLVYPNPTSDLLTIQSETGVYKAELFTIDGQQVIETSSDQLDLSQLSIGTYIIKVLTNRGRVFTEQVIKL